MNSPQIRGATAPRYRAVPYPRRETVCERRPDGTLIIRSAKAPAPLQHLGFAGYLPHWAQDRGAQTAFAERDAQGQWRRLSWAQLWRQVQSVGVALLEMGLGPSTPVMMLSGNSLEQLVLMLAADYVGVPTAPVSPAYALRSQDFARLKGVAELVPPAAVFVQNGAEFAVALAALKLGQVPVIAVHDGLPGHRRWDTLVETALTPERLGALAAAHAALQAEATARILFTSGSTGAPKGVPLSYRNLQAVAANMLDMFEALVGGEPPVFLDWLPWHHGLGGVLNLGRVIVLGGTHYIDDGRPLPGQFDKTVRNLREISPTVMNTVPSAWTMLVGELERDPVLAHKLFDRVLNFSYGGASLPSDVHERIQRVAERTVGERIVFGSGLSSTETAGVGTNRYWLSSELADIGAPAPGTELKLLPLDDGRYELRLRGAQVFAGYVGRPDLTQAAFDDEGFFRIGDALRLIDPADPGGGMRFDGRVGEDFKLVNGTWVRTGAVRLGLIEQCAPLITDAVICGHDHAYVAALAWPNVAACQRLAPELAGLDTDALVKHPTLIAVLSERLRASGGSSTTRVERLMLMAEPPSMDANEIADKGYVNQAATRTRRAGLVAELFQPEPAAHIALAR